MKAWFLKVIYYGIPVVILVASLLALNSGPIQTRWMSAGEEIPVLLQEISERALADRWQEANASAVQLQKAWHNVRGRLRLSAGVGEIEDFDLELAELQGAVEAKDQAQVRIAHRRVWALWEDLSS